MVIIDMNYVFYHFSMPLNSLSPVRDLNPSLREQVYPKTFTRDNFSSCLKTHADFAANQLF